MIIPVKHGDEVVKRGARDYSLKQPPKPLYLVEQEASQFIRYKRFDESAWSPREARSFAFFVDYLRMLRVDSYDRVNVEFFNDLRMNVIYTYYEGSLGKQGLYALCAGIDEFLDSKLDSGLTPLFYGDEIYDLILERNRKSRFDSDSFEETLDELRKRKLHTEAALLEVVRYLGLTLKEAMQFNPALSLKYAQKHGHIVVRNQDQQLSRRIPIWNEEQSTALIRLATNRLLHDPEWNSSRKHYAYIFYPLTQVYKALGHHGMSVYALRNAYFEEEFYQSASFDMRPEQISHLAHKVSHQMGHSYCFNDSYLLKQNIDPLKLVSVQSILEKHPAQLLVPPEINAYVQSYQSRDYSLQSND